MGVPKFFRYTSERYPCLNELVKQYQIPDFDNMYLDMNGIIHNCSHPDDSNPHFRITEEKIFQDVFHYISILFQIIKPKKLFFMAIDGVAPRAKMNQQRGRRFRSAREAEKLEEEALAKGETLPKEKRFDSNCITPGTVFMARLHEQLRYFVKMKMSTDPLWSKVKVILSGHETPGEGEHKIMDYIRWARSQPDYDPNTRHCLYGLDADLIMLGMCSHEPHFALLREEGDFEPPSYIEIYESASLIEHRNVKKVKFGKTTQRATSPEETNFYLLHLTLLREYLEQEFISIKDKLPFPFDIEKIVDDWVLMGFLVGNDFIPNLPNMHINNDALPLLYKTYMAVLPTLDGYINEAGDLHLGRFEIFLQELAKIDKEKFQDTYADLKYFEGKTGRRPNAQERKEYKPNNDETFNVDINDIKANEPDDELQALINATQEMFMDDVDDCNEEFEETSDEEANFESEFLLHKRDYYMNKLDYSKVTDEVLADQAEGYVRAIQWNLFYYYKGCPSWCWYYPHHYAPYISDIKGFKDLKIEFELGEPFKPFEQLLAVLPAASKHLLPTPFHDLMTDEESPIVHYYPVNFETDLNGKRNDWEAVVLIPFIDEANLLSAMAPCYQRLTDEELKRNTHGPMLVYNWTKTSQGKAEAPEYFQTIEDCHAHEQRVWRAELDVPSDVLKRGMLPNADRYLQYPGFPTMRHLKYTTTLRKCKVQVFDQQSRNENMMIQLVPEPYVGDPLEAVGQELLGKVVWAGWPHLTKAKVISVSNEAKRLHHIDKENNNVNGVVSYTTEANFGNLHKQWISERSTILEHNQNRLGIELGDVKTIIHAVNLKGYKYLIQDNSRIALEPEWCSVACGYAYQAIVKDVKEHVMQLAGRFSTPQEAYPPGDSVFLLTQGQYYGCLATVVDSESIRSGRIKVCVREVPEAVPVVRAAASPYRTAQRAAAAAGISPQLLSRLTGTVLVVFGEANDMPTEGQAKTNIGLNLKFNKKNQEVSGYTRRCKTSNAWLYSERCIELVKGYCKEFPELINSLATSMGNDVFFEGDLFPGQVGQKKPQEVVQWIKSQPHMSAGRRECGSEALEPEELRVLYDDIEPQLAELKAQEKKVTLHVKWSLLYKPELHEGNIQPDPTADFKMYDRVVCTARNITVPLGARGTITAIYKPSNVNTVRLADKLNAEPTYQVMFDEPFPGAVTEDLFEEARFYRMLPTNMLNVSYGRKLRHLLQYVSDDVFLPNAPPNKGPTLLRREDGHNSAFACYSPPGDTKSPTIEPRNLTPVANPPAKISDNPQDATHLLRSLLKISDSDDSKKNGKNASEQNWRVKNEPTIQAPQPQRLPQQNWRKENSAANKPGIYQNPAEWANSNYKNQMPLPPYPTFGQPFHGPGPTQIPFPQFQNPHFQRHGNPHYNSNQDRTRYNQNQSYQNQNQAFQNPHQFPKHLPSVAAANNLVPSWAVGQSKPNASQQGANPNPVQNNGEKVNNPFVPLQVQTSQRRNQNPAGSTARKDETSAPQNISSKPLPAKYTDAIAVTSASDADWWQSALIYQIYPRSFKDSNGDGIGDLNGITEKLPYLQQLGVDAIWLSPIYLSPMYDFGYDITDYTKIAPEYGTMEDFDNLMAKAKSLGIRVVLDYVPNHTGNESEWFVKSSERVAGYENYYIWADGVPDLDNTSNLLPPNNWVSIFRKSAWEYSATRGQFYLHQFVIGQPDLNYREPRVQQEMKDVLRFWLDKGVSGFRVDAINMMYEVDASQFGGVYPDEPLSGAEGTTPDDYDYLNHIYTKDLDETYDVVYDWRDLLDEYTAKDGEYKIMMTEAYTELTKMIRYYGTDTRNGSIPFNFSFLEDIKNNSNARDMKLVIDKWMTYMPSGKTANWVNGNHDQSRVASRQGADRVDAMNMLALILPGVALTYQGEEIGMVDGEVTWEQTVDPQACNTDDPVNYWKKSRDPNRTPYHWDATAHAGFSTTTGETWLPVASNYRTLNLAAQMAAEKSHYKFYKDVLAIKKLPAVRSGDLETIAISESVLVVNRLLPGYPAVVGIVNLSDEEHYLDLTSLKLLPVQLRVVASGVDCPHKKDEWMRKSNITLTAHCALLLQTVRKCC